MQTVSTTRRLVCSPPVVTSSSNRERLALRCRRPGHGSPMLPTESPSTMATESTSGCRGTARPPAPCPTQPEPARAGSHVAQLRDGAVCAATARNLMGTETPGWQEWGRGPVPARQARPNRMQSSTAARRRRCLPDHPGCSLWKHERSSMKYCHRHGGRDGQPAHCPLRSWSSCCRYGRLSAKGNRPSRHPSFRSECPCRFGRSPRPFTRLPFSSRAVRLTMFGLMCS